MLLSPLATELKEYIIKGFVLNDEMLKNGKPFGQDYFDELLERIREIRVSERRLYQKLGDIFEQCSAACQGSNFPRRARNIFLKFCCISSGIKERSSASDSFFSLLR